MRRAWLTIGWVAFAAGCSDPASTEPKITGVWEWAQAVVPSSGDTISPATEGFSARLELTATERYHYYEDEELVTEGDFGLANEDGVAEIIGFEPAFGFVGTGMWVGWDAERLHLVPMTGGGYESWWIRSP